MKKILLILMFIGPLQVFAKEKPKVVEINVTTKGFEPSSVNVMAGDSVTLRVTRKTDSTCARNVQISSKNIKKDLPLNQAVSIDLGVLSLGEIRFACGMDMVSGVVHAQ